MARKNGHTHNLKICNVFAEVELTPERVLAIEYVQEMAALLEITPAEFIAEFNGGIPQCPDCGKDE